MLGLNAEAVEVNKEGVEPIVEMLDVPNKDGEVVPTPLVAVEGNDIDWKGLVVEVPKREELRVDVGHDGELEG